MALEILMTPQNGQLVPADALAEADLATLPPRPVMVRITRARSLPMHRRWWALCHALVDGGWFGDLDREAVSSLLKLQAGHVTAVGFADGTRVLIPRSLSFAAADHAEATRVMQAADAWLAAATGLTTDEILERSGMVPAEHRSRT